MPLRYSSSESGQVASLSEERLTLSSSFSLGRRFSSAGRLFFWLELLVDEPKLSPLELLTRRRLRLFSGVDVRGTEDVRETDAGGDFKAGDFSGIGEAGDSKVSQSDPAGRSSSCSSSVSGS